MDLAAPAAAANTVELHNLPPATLLHGQASQFEQRGRSIVGRRAFAEGDLARLVGGAQFGRAVKTDPPVRNIHSASIQTAQAFRARAFTARAWSSRSVAAMHNASIHKVISQVQVNEDEAQQRQG